MARAKSLISQSDRYRARLMRSGSV